VVKLRTISSLSTLSGKTVLLRIDTDVDFNHEKILDDTRLTAALPTIKVILEKEGKINIIGHLGRPKGEDKKFTLYPIAKWLESKFGGSIGPIVIGKLHGWKINENVNLFENLRFFKEEETNDKDFSRELSLLGDIYVNDAFAVSHRAHASVEGVTHFLKSYAGIHLEKEVEELSKILEDPKRPLAVLIGGAKIETKLPLVEKMHHIADYILVGGEIAEQTRILIKVQHEKIKDTKSAVIVSEASSDGFDIDQKSIENFCQILGLAETIVWNGPVGVTGKGVETEKGTRMLAEFITKAKAYKIVGGGDTVSYLRRVDLLDKFDFVSTGGGAMLEFLSGKKLPGVTALEI